MSVQIHKTRLWESIEKLAEYTEPGQPYTRRSFSPMFLQGREWLKRQFIDAGLEVEVDAGGNLMGQYPGRNPELPPIVSGSHSDTVPDGGRFDGIAGVLTALEVARTLKENHIELNRTFVVVDFLAEEPSDYGLSRVGSRALTGDLSADMLQYTAPDGSTLAEGIQRVGGNSSELNQPLMAPGDVAGFFELHIEQGPVLETEQLPIGIVTNIVGITRVDMSFHGRPDHSGTTPMDIRADALAAAAKVIATVNDNAQKWLKQPEYLVATVGKINVQPNASNVVPGRVDMTKKHDKLRPCRAEKDSASCEAA
ncbi:hydantoinase/carbamoylase family amidase [Photobacterium sp. GJ3]|uniref:hydantoinase/carbamoylase family amidase n=1 Tax=Photobacterium sp. GJ3 TaxID=2829502 RepID=UPI001B8B5146|nr:hydantoinase/carbamoylase family amidase [Photobacterium sp. GJ3]QUJ68542.1 hydantoinase/carbamoylase family amidase [Photobacterium sp. GJ3]